LLKFVAYHIYKRQLHLHSICRDHNGMNFYIYARKEVLYCKYYCILGSKYHK
jgi:hypothetical protein